MNKIMTLSIGLLLLVVGCLGFLGCSGGSSSGNTSTTTTAQIAVPTYSATTQTQLSSAAVKPTDTSNTAALATLSPIVIVAPTGYTLSVGPSKLAKAATPANILFSFAGIASGYTNLPLQDDPSGTGNLLTQNYAILPSGAVTMTFPTILMTPVLDNNLTNKVLTLENMSVTFIVNATTGSWTLPTAINLTMNRLSTGYYTINSSLVVASWTNATPASSCNLAGLEIFNSSISTTTPVGTLSNSFTPLSSSSNTIDIIGHSTVPFDTMANANFLFNQ